MAAAMADQQARCRVRPSTTCHGMLLHAGGIPVPAATRRLESRLDACWGKPRSRIQQRDDNLYFRPGERGKGGREAPCFRRRWRGGRAYTASPRNMKGVGSKSDRGGRIAVDTASCCFE